MKLADRPIMCVGDVILDRFVYGDVSRLSPEAPVPVLRVDRTVCMPGGAANVARNVSALGGVGRLVAAAGDDPERLELMRLLDGAPRVSARIAAAPGRRTIVKTRLVGNRQQIVRLDIEDAQPFARSVEAGLCHEMETGLRGSAAVVLSDYRKGLLSQDVISRAVSMARAAGLPVFVDPKGTDFGKYRGATCLTPNLAELRGVLGDELRSDADIAEGAAALVTRLDLEAILVTLSERGMLLVERGGKVQAIPAFARQVADVSGAGDTVIATLALASGSGLPLETGMRMANAAAAVVVGKPGTALCSREELEEQLRVPDTPVHSKVLGQWDALERRVRRWKSEGQVVGFTNGCFDILHAGHVKLLKEAKGACDRLVVGVNSDRSVSRLKGPSRPFNTALDRCAVLEALAAVDAITIFDDDTPANLIQRLVPDVIVKGGDYTPDSVVGAEVVRAAGGRVVIVDLLPGLSTTELSRRRLGVAAVAE
ncbi:D-glycero-beta-D-manno-heptose-7-phosphate kinase [Alsobacter sp. R-9]